MYRFFDGLKKHILFFIASLLLTVLLVCCFAGEQITRGSFIYLLPLSIFVLFCSFYLKNLKAAASKIDFLALVASFILAGSFCLNSFLSTKAPAPSALTAAVQAFVLIALFYFLFVYSKRLWFSDGFIMSGSPYKHKELIFPALVFILCIALYHRYFPYLSSPDTTNQWEQIHGNLNYNKIHTVGHTLFLKGLLSLYDNFVTVIIVQLISLVAVYLLFYIYFRKKGLAPWILVPVFSIALIISVPATQHAYFYPWKDTPAALCIAVLVLIILRYNDTGKMSCRCSLILGLALVWCRLFRLNGIIVLVICGAGFCISFLKRKYYRQLAAMISAAAISAVFVNVYSAAVLKPADYENGFSVQFFGSGLAAMVKSGELNEDELARIGEILPLEWMEYGYDRSTYKLALIWEPDGSAQIAEDPNLEIFNNQFVLDMGENKKELIRLYLELMPKHFITCAKDMLGSLHMMWKMDLRFMERYLFQFSLIAFLALGAKLRLKDYVVFVPTACNTISIMVSTITNETRYLLPSFMLMPVFFLYICQKAHEKRA